MFLFFDLGKVLVHFDAERMFRQIGDLAGLEPRRVREVLVDQRLERRYERGEITRAEFYETFCQTTGTRPDPETLARTASDIFELNVSMLPVVAQLQAAGYRLGVLSNTSPDHWEHCLRRYRILGEAFEVIALSYELGAMKPEPEIYQAAARLAAVAPQEIFYTDDIAGHVAGARAVGFDAVQYVTTPQLVEELRRRGVRFNY